MAEKADFKIIHGAPRAVSRRDFIKGVVASGAAVSSASYLFRASSLLHGQELGAGERLLTLNVNGHQRRVDVMKQETLAWTLRYKLGLTGTKLGCDRAECGACTVLDRRRAALFVFGSDTHSARQESSHHRRAGEPRRHAAPGATGRHR